MYPGLTVTKRNGRKEPLDISKIRKVTQAACEGLGGVDFNELEADAGLQFRDGISTEEIQKTLIQTAVDKIDIDRPNWNFVAARLFLYDMRHKVAGFNGYPHIKDYFEKGEKEGRIIPGLKEKYNLEEINSYIVPERDLQFTYLGIKTLYDRYVLKDKEGNPIELPQHLFMGVAMFLAQNETNPESIPEKDRNKVNLNDPKSIRGYWAKQFYDRMSLFEVMMATPTLSNARTLRHQLSSCFVGSMGDNIEGIFDSFKEMALLSKFGGGIGWDVSKVRALGSFIDNHKNASGGVIPWLKITNDVAIAVDQLGCVRRDSEVIRAKKLVLRNKEYDLTHPEMFYDIETIVDMVASFASNYGFEITIKGKTYSKNFVSTFIYDYVKLSKSYINNVKKIAEEKDKSKDYKTLKITYLKEKFYDTLSSYYGVDKEVIEEIIYRFSKKPKGIPEGFKHKVYKNTFEEGFWSTSLLIFEGNGFYITIDKNTFAIEKIKTFEKKGENTLNLELLIESYNDNVDITGLPLVETKEELMSEFKRTLDETEYSECCKRNTLEVVEGLLDILVPLRDARLLWSPSGFEANYLSWELVSKWLCDIEALKKLNAVIKKSNESGFLDNSYLFDKEEAVKYSFIDNSRLNKILNSYKIENYANVIVPFIDAMEKMKKNPSYVKIETEAVPIGFVKPGNYVLSYEDTEEKAVFKKVLGVYDIDVKTRDQIKITKDTGEYIITSKWHPFPVIRNGQFMYVRSDEVKEGDVSVSVKYNKGEIQYKEECSIISIEELLPDETFEEFKDLTVEDTNNYFCRIKARAPEESFMLIHNTRKGAIAVYLEPWHMDITDFLDLKKNSGEERRRAHDLFPALWIPDLFMKRVKEDGWWTLFDPYDVADLTDLYGEDFEKRYIEYENDPDIPKRRIKAKELWKKILLEYYETGNPFLCFKDNANKRNQNDHAGIIRSSNLCSEIFQNTNPNYYEVEVTYEDGTKERFQEEEDVEVMLGEDVKTIVKGKKITSIHYINGKKVDFVEKVPADGKTAVCNLASVNLSKVNTPEKIEEVIPVAVRMLDNVIDLNYYPVRKTKDTNAKNRAIGLGAMGEAEMLAVKRIHWGSDKHLKLIDEIFERISYEAIKASANLAEEKGVYPDFKGSRWEKGILPIDTANANAKKLVKREYVCDWESLRKKVKNGMRNGYLMAIAPTSSISILSGTTQAIEPVYKRKWYEENMSGLIPVVVPKISPDTYMYYTPAYELDQRILVKAAAVRQKWVDQGQSLNIFIDPDKASGKYLNEIYTLGWELGLKSFYYLRSKSPEAEKDVMDRSVECFGCQ